MKYTTNPCEDGILIHPVMEFKGFPIFIFTSPEESEDTTRQDLAGASDFLTDYFGGNHA